MQFLLYFATAVSKAGLIKYLIVTYKMQFDKTLRTFVATIANWYLNMDNYAISMGE